MLLSTGIMAMPMHAAFRAPCSRRLFLTAFRRAPLRQLMQDIVGIEELHLSACPFNSVYYNQFSAGDGQSPVPLWMQRGNARQQKRNAWKRQKECGCI